MITASEFPKENASSYFSFKIEFTSYFNFKIGYTSYFNFIVFVVNETYGEELKNSKI